MSLLGLMFNERTPNDRNVQNHNSAPAHPKHARAHNARGVLLGAGTQWGLSRIPNPLTSCLSTSERIFVFHFHDRDPDRRPSDHFLTSW